jgi:phosphohistidine phosphatase SixA
MHPSYPGTTPPGKIATPVDCPPPPQMDRLRPSTHALAPNQRPGQHPKRPHLPAMPNLSRRALLAAPFLIPARPARADEAAALLARPGHLGIMRHADAPGIGDPPAFRLDDCATQRNLGPRGRAQATLLGDRLREAGLRDPHVLTSQWCRARETARLLGFGPPDDLEPLNSFFAERAEGPARTAALRAWIAAAPDRPTLLVTHQVNITALTGIFPASGEMLVLRRTPDDLAVTARLPPT